MVFNVLDIGVDEFWVKNLRNKNNSKADSDCLCENEPKFLHMVYQLKITNVTISEKIWN